MLKKRYLFLIMLVCLFVISAVSAEENTSSNIVRIDDSNGLNDLYDDVIIDNDFKNTNVTNNQNILGSSEETQDEFSLYYKDDVLFLNSPSASYYNVYVSDVEVIQGNIATIQVSIDPSTNNRYYYYDFYLKIYDSGRTLNVSPRYQGNSLGHSITYSIDTTTFSPGTYMIYAVNFEDKRIMDSGKLTIKSPYSHIYPYYSDYSVNISDTRIIYGSSGYISMNISPSYRSDIKYYYYLKVYDSSNNEKISQLYYGNYPYLNKYYLKSNSLEVGVYTIKIINYADNNVMNTARLIVRSSNPSTYPSYLDYSVSVSDVSINYGSNGTILMTISPDSISTYKYYFYLKVFDSSLSEKISQLYYSTNSYYSETYNLNSNGLVADVYTIKIYNFADNRLMDSAKLTIEPLSTYPSYSDYSVNISDVTINYRASGSIPMKIFAASSSDYKYYYYLKIYDSSGNEKVSKLYYSTNPNHYDYHDYNFKYNSLGAGVYTIKIINYMDNKVMNTAKLILKESPTKILVPNVTKYFHGSEKLEITLTEYGSPVANADVKITINEIEYSKTTDVNGRISMSLQLNSGVYDVTTAYNNTKSYSTVTIKDTIIANGFTKMFRNGTQYSATFVDSRGNALKNTAVKLNINGVFYTRKTDANGVAKMNINLNPGTYILTATNPVTNEMHATTITVLGTILENNDLTKYYKNASQYSLRLLDDKGNPVGAGVEVKFNINGVFYTRTTNSLGYAKMNINLNPGNYIITAEYKGLKVSNSIKVLSILVTSDLEMEYGSGSQFEVKLLDGKGNIYPNQKIKFNINGVFYTRTTDSDGFAKLNIRLLPGTYIITSTYNGLNIANTIKVNPEYVPSPTTDTGSSSSRYVETYLCSNAKFDSNAYVEVKIYTENSYNTYYGKTDFLGQFSIPIRETVNEVHKIEIKVGYTGLNYKKYSGTIKIYPNGLLEDYVYFDSYVDPTKISRNDIIITVP